MVLVLNEVSLSIDEQILSIFLLVGKVRDDWSCCGVFFIFHQLLS